MRIRTAAVVAALAAGSVSACSPADEGSAALLLGKDGELVALVKTCDATVEGVRVDQAPLDYEEEPVVVGAVDADVDEESTDQVATGVALDDLEGAQWYRLIMETTDEYDGVHGVGFALADIAALEPGQVLVGRYHDRAPNFRATESTTPFELITPSTPVSPPPEPARVLTEDQFLDFECN